MTGLDIYMYIIYAAHLYAQLRDTQHLHLYMHCMLTPALSLSLSHTLSLSFSLTHTCTHINTYTCTHTYASKINNINTTLVHTHTHTHWFPQISNRAPAPSLHHPPQCHTLCPSKELCSHWRSLKTRGEHGRNLKEAKVTDGEGGDGDCRVPALQWVRDINYQVNEATCRPHPILSNYDTII